MRTPDGGGSGPTRRRASLLSCGLLAAAATLCGGSTASADEPKKPPVRFERVVIDDNFPGAYQVEVADVNGDGKPDVVALGGGTCAWYENPTWKKRIVTGPKQTPGVISSATADLDGDGKAEIAIAYEFSMNVPTRGKLLLARQGKTLDDPWTIKPVADIGSIHRLRWMRYEMHVSPSSVRFGPLPAGKEPEPGVKSSTTTALVIAPIFGPSAKPPQFNQEPAHLSILNADRGQISSIGGGGGLGGGRAAPGGPKPPVTPGGIGPAAPGGSRLPITVGGNGPNAFSPDLIVHTPREIGKAPVMHAIDVVDLHGKGVPVILSASNLGVTMHSPDAIAGTTIYGSHPLVAGAPGEAPRKGASEVHAGKLKDGRRFLTTVEPWHGTDVAVYLSEALKPLPTFGPRTVIDTTLKEGHALWVADVDGDGDDEVFAGYRGPGTSVLMFDYNGKTWDRTVVDADIAAQDLRGGDLDGNGTPDVVAVGGKTHNVVWYRPRKD